MDTKITKKRLNDFLSYEWIKLIALAAAGILLWSLIFTMTSVRLNVGQQFKIFLYQDIAAGDSFGAFGNKLKEKGAISFDILDYSSESLLSGSVETVLQARFAVHEGDLMIISNTDDPEQASEFKSFVDRYNDAYKINILMADAKNYYEKYYDTDGKMNYIYLKSAFKERMKKDKRYKSETDYEKGAIQEAARIDTLKRAWAAVADYIKGEGKLVNYAKYTQMLAQNDNIKDITAETEEHPYGINISGRENITDLFKLRTDGSAEGLTIIVLDRRAKQPHLQFEVLPVIAEILGLDY